MIPWKYKYYISKWANSTVHSNKDQIEIIF